jgi:hypothetical protein
MISLQVVQGTTLQVPPERHTLRRLVPVVYRKDETQKCQNPSQCNRMRHSKVASRLLLCVFLSLCVSLSLCLFLCLMQKQNYAKERRLHRIHTLQQLMQCTKWSSPTYSYYTCHGFLVFYFWEGVISPQMAGLFLIFCWDSNPSGTCWSLKDVGRLENLSSFCSLTDCQIR